MKYALKFYVILSLVILVAASCGPVVSLKLDPVNP